MTPEKLHGAVESEDGASVLDYPKVKANLVQAISRSQNLFDQIAKWVQKKDDIKNSRAAVCTSIEDVAHQL